MSWLDDVDDDEAWAPSLDYYEYDQLGPRTIRAISLHQGTGFLGMDGPVEVDICHINLDDGVSFDAISYTWGPPTVEEKDALDQQVFTSVQRCYPIICNERIVRVTKSLRDLLSRLRAGGKPDIQDEFAQHFDRKRAKYLWADGICINQDDLEERGRQVKLMGDVYHKASTVFGWVGEQDQSARNALDASRQIFHHASKAVADIGTEAKEFGGDMLRQDKNERLKAIRRPPLSTLQWRDWAIFLCREWFHRTWVVQEIALAGPTNMQLLCGTRHFGLEAIVFGAIFVQICNWSPAIWQEFEDRLGQNRLYQLHKPRITKWLLYGHPIIYINKAWEYLQNGKKPPYYNLCRSTLLFTGCTDPRDKIYATLGISAEFEADKTGYRHTLSVDYSRSVQEVYCEATKHVLQYANNLRLLCLVFDKTVDHDSDHKFETLQELPGLPSWCPDYSSGYRMPFLMMESLDDSLISWKASGQSQYHASAIVQEQDRIALSGVSLDTVCDAVVLQKWMTDLATFNSILRLLLSAARQTPPNGAAVQCLATSFSSTMICGEWPMIPEGIEDPDVDNAKAFGNALTFGLCSTLWKPNGNSRINQAELMEMRQLIDDISLRACEPCRALPDVEFLLQELSTRKSWAELDIDSDYAYAAATVRRKRFLSWLMLRVQSLINSRSYGRSLFSTKSCSLGLGHACVQPGDEVWLLAGSKVPFVLRPSSGGHRKMVGEAFVHGVMYGEAWPTKESELKTVILH